MGRERFIENNIIRNRSTIFGAGDLPFIRRSRIGLGFGVADLVLFPSNGPYRMIIVEAKQASSADSKSKVVGQLLMYYAGALRLGYTGLRMMRSYAESQPRSARSLRPISLLMLNGGQGPPAEAWRSLCRGRRLQPNRIALFAALDSEPGSSLKAALSELAEHHDLSIGVISVLKADDIRTWQPKRDREPLEFAIRGRLAARS
jgi:hypothetical protein